MANKRTLAELEMVIRRGLQTVMEVGEALQEIRSRKLYKAEYSTFEQYCRERWGMGRSSAYDYIKATAVGRALQNQGQEVPPTIRQALAAGEAQERATESQEQISGPDYDDSLDDDDDDEEEGISAPKKRPAPDIGTNDEEPDEEAMLLEASQIIVQGTNLLLAQKHPPQIVKKAKDFLQRQIRAARAVNKQWIIPSQKQQIN